MAVADLGVASRAADLYEAGGSFVDAYAVAVAEREACGVANFDRRITRRSNVKRIEP